MINLSKNKRAWTTIELVLVCLVTVLTFAFIILYTHQSIAKTNNARRHADLNAIFKAVYEYSIDYGGEFPDAITDTKTEICKTDAEDCTGLIDLSVLTDQEMYLIVLAEDPRNPKKDTNGTSYTINTDKHGRIVLSAPLAELGHTIQITK